MKFPHAGDIASTSVVFIEMNNTISDAIEKMIHNEHRDIVVIDSDKYYILTALEIIKINKNNIELATPLSEIELMQIPIVHKDVNILNLLGYLNEETEFICVKNSDETLYGIITHTDITSNIDPAILMDNYTIDDFFKLTRRIKWIDKNMITEDTLNDMAKNSFDSVVIVENFKPIGILTTKDVVKLIKDQADLKLPVSEYMVSPVDCVNKSISIGDALEFVKVKHYKRLIVVNDSGKLTGVITQKELISLTYTRWSLMMREHQEELREINSMLKTQNREYELLASTDPLTGLYNRYKFIQLYNSSHKTMCQRKGSMSLIILDIDYFKKVNDLYGHNMGDRALKNIAQLLLTNTREIDMVCRWGGEEFVLLLPTVTLPNALIIAEKLRSEIENTQIDGAGTVTSSFGVAEVDDSSTIDEVIDRADKALYQAKISGRNCIRPEL